MSERLGPRPVAGVYPEALADAEDALLRLRHGLHAGQAPEVPLAPVGVAVSGGGIRSATFALGVFQGLARLRLLRRIDYLSTVSGGSYFGASYSRLFSRAFVSEPADVENVLHPTRARADRPDGGHYLRWLRLNGRYLAPTGSGDLLVDVAIVLRNWLALMAVVLFTLLMNLLLLQILRIGIEQGLAAASTRSLATSLISAEHARAVQAVMATAANAFANGGAVGWLNEQLPVLSWSPVAHLVLPTFLLLAFPLGWAFWMVGWSTPTQSRSKRWRDWAINRWRFLRGSVWRLELHPLWGLFFVLATSVWLLRGDLPLSDPARTGLWLLAVLAVLTLIQFISAVRAGFASVKRSRTEVWRVIGWSLALWKSRSLNVTEVAAIREAEGAARTRLSQRLATGLRVIGVIAVLAVLDSIGQTIYLLWTEGQSAWTAGLGVMSALSLPLALRAARIPQMMERFGLAAGASSSVRLPVDLIAAALATLAVTVVVGGVDAVAHGIAWRGESPRLGCADCANPASTGVAQARALKVSGSLSLSGAEPAPARNLKLELSLDPPAPDAPRALRLRDTRESLAQPALGLGLLAGLCFLFGRAWSFLNRSSQHSMYHSRLIRAYLGASNPRRIASNSDSVADPTAEDDGRLEVCWGRSAFSAGAPIHLVNVTVNETASDRGKTVYRDRKGIGMAVGPCGYSAGRGHHALYDGGSGNSLTLDGRLRPLRRGAEFQMFSEDGQPHLAEPLSLGHWVAISGAAFTTGTGYRTSLPLSLLMGLANVRLGYWWDAGISPLRRLAHQGGKRESRARRIARRLRALFPVQAYFLDEFTATFRGPDEAHWYLSDGGHFENMGAYELIRRRLPVMVVVDGEADPEYSYEGLANLIRKSRMDFNAEIRFLDDEELGEKLHRDVRPSFGALSALKPDEHGCSRAHAALAQVRYDGRDEVGSWLIYLKPALRGDEPADVREYQYSNKPFPQQTTLDQFFDESQWESYRRLGEHVASAVFREVDPACREGTSGWVPNDLRRP